MIVAVIRTGSGVDDRVRNVEQHVVTTMIAACSKRTTATVMSRIVVIYRQPAHARVGEDRLDDHGAAVM